MIVLWVLRTMLVVEFMAIALLLLMYLSQPTVHWWEWPVVIIAGVVLGVAGALLW